MSTSRGRSIRAYILSIVLFGAIAPLALIGAWVTATAVRSGKELLREQLAASLDAMESSIHDKWTLRRGDLLLLADNLAARHAVTTERISAEDSAYLGGLYRRLSRDVQSFVFVDAGGQERWSSSQIPLTDNSQTPPRQASIAPTIRVTLPMHDDAAHVVGQLDARLTLDGLVSTDSGHLGVPGATLAVRDGATRGSLVSSSRVRLPEADGEMRSGDSTWIVVHRRIETPQLELALGAPTGSYVAPFEHAARLGFIAVVLVALIALLLSAYLTLRLTRPLDRLVDAASAVSRGDLERHVDPGGPREIDTLADSFNTMTDSVKRAMTELSRQSALAAVGEFAASLAHEVRNALTAIKLDLQRAEERLPDESSSRELVSRSLSAVTQLDSTVTGALRIGRSGSVTPQPLDLASVLASAAKRTAPMFAATSSTLQIDVSPPNPLPVTGDPAALEELFVNLFANAAQALATGGAARVSARSDNGSVVIAVADDGRGIDAEHLDHVLEPFYSTRLAGTGLGLPIARQLAVAHGGDLKLESQPGVGTTVTVRLPRGSSAPVSRGSENITSARS